MIKMNQSPILNQIQLTAQVTAILKGLQGESTVAVVTKTIDPTRPDFPQYDVYACKGGIVGGHLVES